MKGIQMMLNLVKSSTLFFALQTSTSAAFQASSNPTKGNLRSINLISGASLGLERSDYSVTCLRAANDQESNLKLIQDSNDSARVYTSEELVSRGDYIFEFPGRVIVNALKDHYLLPAIEKAGCTQLLEGTNEGLVFKVSVRYSNSGPDNLKLVCIEGNADQEMANQVLENLGSDGRSILAHLGRLQDREGFNIVVSNNILTQGSTGIDIDIKVARS